MGTDYFWNFIQDHVVQWPGPTAVQSKLGYVLSGPLQLAQEAMTTSLNITLFHCASQSPGKNLCLWNSEPNYATDKQLIDRFPQWYMQTHIRVLPDGTYSLHFPWEENHPPLPSKLSVCTWQTRSMVHQLAKTPELLRQYSTIIAEHERKGFIERVPKGGCTSCTHYIPHHPVRKK